MKLKLYNYWRSSASHRVRIALHLKQLPYEYLAVNLLHDEQRATPHLGRNPSGQVPALEVVEHDGTSKWLAQSLPIIEYLDERVPDRPLLPRDSYLRARTRALAEIVNSGIQPHQNLTTLSRVKALGGDPAGWVKTFIADGLAAYDRACDDVAGAFSVGDVPTLADCFLIPQLAGARRFNTPIESARLLAIEARCLALPAFAEAMPERQPDAVRS